MFDMLRMQYCSTQDQPHYMYTHLCVTLPRICQMYLLLVTGAHTRSIAVTTPSNASGGIMKFAKKKLACLNCKAPIAAGSLCAHCSPKVCCLLLPF